MNKLRADYEHLRWHIVLLTELLEQHAVDANVFSFPAHTADDLGVMPDVIPIKAFDGQVAIAKALLHYHHFQTDKDQPGPFILKLAGTLSIECGTDVESEIRRRIEAINQLKDKFKSLILSLHTSQDTRFEMFSDALPNLCKLSITRHIPVAMPGIKRINFAWTNRKVGGTFKQKALLKKIDNARSQQRPSDMMGEWLAGLDREEQLIAGYPSTALFIERRGTRTTPMMKLHYPNEHKPKETTIHAHSPLVIINGQPKQTALNTYIRPPADNEPDEKYELVIPRLALYLLSLDGTIPAGSKRLLKEQVITDTNVKSGAGTAV